MKTLATISMALVVGSMAMGTALAGSKGGNSSGSCHHNDSGCCHHNNDSGCCHKKPCDPGKGKTPPVVVDPVHKPPFPVAPINPVMSPPVSTPPSGGSTIPGRGLIGIGGAIGGITILNPGTPVTPTQPSDPITGTHPGSGGNLRPF